MLASDGGAVTGAKVFPMMVRVDPASGSVIRNTQISAFPLPDELAKRLAATTGADGRGTIAGVAPADLAGVLIEAPGSGRQHRRRDRRSPTGTSSFGLRRSGGWRVGSSSTIPSRSRGSSLFVFTLSAAGGPNGSSGRAEAVPDASGRFEVSELPVGNLYITVKVPENSTLKFITPRNKSIEAGRLTEVTITEQKPPKTRTLAGRVVDAKGNPVAGATVFQSGDAPARTETTSDAEGRFSLPGVAEASTFVFARAKGFRFAGRSRRRPARRK